MSIAPLPSVELGSQGLSTHMLGNSLSTMRLFAEMGVRYVTLSHVCHTGLRHWPPNN